MTGPFLLWLEYARPCETDVIKNPILQMRVPRLIVAKWPADGGKTVFLSSSHLGVVLSELP